MTTRRRTDRWRGAAAAVLASGLAACTSTHTTPQAPSTTISTSASTSIATTPPGFDPGFTLIYDTVTDSFAGGQVWISRGGISREVPAHGAELIMPVPAPAGKSLLVERLLSDGSGGTDGQIEVIDLTGRVLKRLPDSAGCFPGGWDGNAVILGCSSTGQAWQIVRVNLSTNTRKVLAPDDGGDPPSVSPDGKLVAFGYRQKTWIVPSKGGKPKMVLPRSEGGAWSPDGKHLAITGHTEVGNSALFLVNADGSGKRQITDIETEGLETFETFSPDGTKILLAGSADVPYTFYEVAVDGTGYHELIPPEVGGDPQRLP